MARPVAANVMGRGTIPAVWRVAPHITTAVISPVIGETAAFVIPHITTGVSFPTTSLVLRQGRCPFIRSPGNGHNRRFCLPAWAEAARFAEPTGWGRIVAVTKTPLRKRGQSRHRGNGENVDCTAASPTRCSGGLPPFSTRLCGIAGEFVRVMTEDGMELQGFYTGRNQKSDTRMQKSELSAPKLGPRPLTPGPLCVVHVHGWDGNFYENRFIDHAARVCTEQGIGFVSGNNRGHDYIADVLRTSRRQKSEGRSRKAELTKREAERCDYVQIGGMYEKLADSVADIRAWIDFADSCGAKRVILQGHSHGAIKATNYLVTTHDPRVCGLILLSPSDDMGIARKQLGERFLWVLARARELVRAGKGRQLLPERDSQYPVSAATFFDCHNKGSITGIFNMSRTDRRELPELASISVPVLMAVGAVDEAFVGAPQKYVADVAAHLVNCPSFTGAVIDGAPHNYLGREAQLARVLQKWLRPRIQGVKESRIRGKV